MEKVLRTIFKYRYILAATLFAACVFVGLNGSSIGCIARLFGHEDSGVLLGMSRSIRSDEYGTFTPMTFAQYLDPKGSFQYFSSVMRGDTTDAFITYGQPVKSWLMIFRPFQIGFLFLPVAQGMAFFWCGRFIALFMVSFEFGRLITDDKKGLSVLYAVMVAFAPAVLWWFAINGFVEMIIAAEFSVVLFSKYMKNEIRDSLYLIKKAGLALGIMLSAGAFVLTLYPAWMVPMAYLVLFLIIWQLKDNPYFFKTSEERSSDSFRSEGARDAFKIITDIIVLFVMLFIIGIALYTVSFRSTHTISAIMNTAYPGKRIENGGGALKHMFNYVAELWYSKREASPFYNVCESAYFIDFFPLAHILFIICSIKNKKLDFLGTLLFVLSTFFFIYIAVGFSPELISLTKMGYSTANRTLVVFTFVNLIMLFRAISLNTPQEEETSKNKIRVLAILITLAIISTAVLVSRSINPGYYSIKMLAVTAAVLGFIIYGFIAKGTGIHKSQDESEGTIKIDSLVWGIILATIIIASGILVNPIRVGVKAVTDIPELRMAEKVSQADREALWIVEGEEYPVTDTLLFKGIRTVNSTNVYPDLERWKLLDPAGEYEDIYNRYAHIEMILHDGDLPDRFELIHPDTIRVNVSYEDLMALGVRYIFTKNELDSESYANESDSERYEKIDQEGEYLIYRLKY